MNSRFLGEDILLAKGIGWVKLALKVESPEPPAVVQASAFMSRGKPLIGPTHPPQNIESVQKLRCTISVDRYRLCQATDRVDMIPKWMDNHNISSAY